MSQLKKHLADARRNPALMQQLILDELAKGLDGNYDITDPTNPFIFLMESSVVNSSMALTEQEGYLSTLYPSMARDSSDLYNHMSDVDYVNRFASPAEANFDFYIPLDEIRTRAVTIGNNLPKLTIPRFTKVSVGELTFTLQFPIEIRVKRHGGILITYDTSVTSPVKTLSTNVLDWDVVTMPNFNDLVETRFVRISVPIQQFDISSVSHILNASTHFSVDLPIRDQFYHARVFHQKSDGAWEELKTTHSEQVYDPTVPTALLKKKDSVLNVSLPTVYTYGASGMSGTIRVDIYSTKGPVHTDLGSYSADQFTWEFRDLGEDTSATTAPLTSMSLFVLSTEMLDGGSNGKTFEELRNQVLSHTLGANDIPVSKPQLSSRLDTLGFNIVKTVDNVSSQQFLATRQLPVPANQSLSSPMGTTMAKLRYPIREMIGVPNVLDHGSRITLTPEVLYSLENGKTQFVSLPMLDRLKSLNGDSLSREVNSKRYFYSPFYYVLDTSDQTFKVRAYDLSTPKVIRKTFIGDNDTAGVQVVIEGYQIEKVQNGYRLYLQLGGDSNFNELATSDIVVQASYRSYREYSWCATNAKLVGEKDNSRFYTVDIETQYDIDEHDALQTTNFSLLAANQTRYGISLEPEFDITAIVVNQDVQDYRPSAIDAMIQHHLLNTDTGVKCVLRERLSLKLGAVLHSLWAPHRVIPSNEDYVRWEKDVPYVYDKDEYVTDERGDPIIKEVDGNIEYTVVHRKGDPVLNDKGVQLTRYRAGDVRVGNDGKPLLRHVRERLLEFSMMLADGVFYFVTDEEALRYRSTCASTLTTWVDQLKGLEDKLLDDNTRMFLHPIQNIGDTHALILDGQQSIVNINQTIAVNYFVTDAAFRNSQFREAISLKTRQVVSDCLNKPTVSISDIVATLKSVSGDDIISFEVTGLGGSLNLSTISMLDDATRLALGKRLVVRSNRTLSVEDAIDVNFVRHSA